MNRKCCVSLIALAMLALIASPVMADMVVNVRALPGAGYTVSGDGKSITVANPNTAVTMAVYATISGTNGVYTDDAIQTLYGSISQTHNNLANGTGALALASPSNGYVSPFDASTSTPPSSADVLGTVGSSSGTTSMVWRSNSMIANNNGLAAGQEYELGTFNYTANPVDGQMGLFSTIQYNKPGAAVGSATFKIDNASLNGLAAGLTHITVGTGVSVYAVPEPSTLILLGMGLVSLLFIRRRK